MSKELESLRHDNEADVDNLPHYEHFYCDKKDIGKYVARLGERGYTVCYIVPVGGWIHKESSYEFEHGAKARRLDMEEFLLVALLKTESSA